MPGGKGYVNGCALVDTFGYDLIDCIVCGMMKVEIVLGEHVQTDNGDTDVAHGRDVGATP